MPDTVYGQTDMYAEEYTEENREESQYAYGQGKNAEQKKEPVYAVRKGRTCGVMHSYGEYFASVGGYSGYDAKRFPPEEELSAAQWMHSVPGTPADIFWGGFASHRPPKERRIYAVRKGRRTGLLRTYREFLLSQNGYVGFEGRAFPLSETEDAENWLAGAPCREEREKAERPAKERIYAVRRGRVCGILRSADEYYASVKGYPGAEAKSFSALAEKEAEEWAAEEPEICPGRLPAFGTEPGSAGMPGGTPFAFTDGSYCFSPERGGFGAVLAENGRLHLLRGSAPLPGGYQSCLQAECAAAEAAEALAAELGLKTLCICSDSIPAIRAARRRQRKGPEITFAYVKGHSLGRTGREGGPGAAAFFNAAADALARSASGVRASEENLRVLGALGAVYGKECGFRSLTETAYIPEAAGIAEKGPGLGNGKEGAENETDEIRGIRREHGKVHPVRGRRRGGSRKTGVLGRKGIPAFRFCILGIRKNHGGTVGRLPRGQNRGKRSVHGSQRRAAPRSQRKPA